MISPLAYIHPDAKLAEGITVEPFTTIYGDVTIGAGTWVGPNVTIMDGARIGSNCQIFPGAVVSGIPQDLKFDGEKTTAVVGDHTVLRECVTVNRGTVDRGETRVGAHCLLQAYVHVAHDCLIGDNCVISGTTQIAGHVTVGDWAILGGGALVQQFVRIGPHAFIGGGTLVRKDVPPYVKAGREPLAYAGVNSVGLRRRGFSDAQLLDIHNLYRLLFLSGHNTQDALERIEAEITPSADRHLALDFVRSASRGIIKSPSRKNREEED